MSTILDALSSSVKNVMGGVGSILTPKPPVIQPVVASPTPAAFPNRVTPYAPTTDIKSIISAPIKSTVPAKPLLSAIGSTPVPNLTSTTDVLANFFGTNKSMIQPGSQLEKTIEKGKEATTAIKQSTETTGNKIFGGITDLAKGVEQSISPTTKVIEGDRVLDNRKRDWGDVGNLIPVFVAQLHGAGLTVAELATGKSLGEKQYPAFNNEKIAAEGAQTFYNEEVAKGVPKNQALISAWLKAGMDIVTVAGLTRSVGKFGYSKYSPESLLKTTDINTQQMREFVATGKPLPKDVQDVFLKLDNQTKANVVKGITNTIMEPTPSKLGTILGVTEDEAKALFKKATSGSPITDETRQLPGYRAETGQAPAFGLSTERVEPVGFHNYNEPVVDAETGQIRQPETGQDVKSILSKPIGEVVGTARVGETEIPIKKGGQVSIPEPTTPGLFDEQKVKPPVYEGEKDLTTSTLNKLKGRSTVSKTFIENLTNQPDLKQQEREIIREKLKDYPDGSQVPVAEFAGKVKAELLPLKRSPVQKEYYENISLPTELRGNVENYREHIYNSPIKTSAGEVHFSDNPKASVENYFGHTRVEDVPGNTRRVIEVQSDLYQKGNLEKEVPPEKVFNNGLTVNYKGKPYKVMGTANGRTFATLKSGDEILHNIHIDDVDLAPSNKIIESRRQEVSKLSQYNDPTAHFRMVREEIKKAAEDGKTKLQFPTGETAMKIEGLGSQNRWESAYRTPLKIEDLKVGKQVRDMGDSPSVHWIITKVEENGKFEAVTQHQYDDAIKSFDEESEAIGFLNQNKIPETFDISGKVDTNNPIYRFYEKDLGRYLTNKFGAQVVTDKQGVKWYEVPISKDMTGPVQAFKQTVFPKFGGRKLSLDEITKIVYADIPKPEVRLIFRDDLIDGVAEGRYSKSTLEGADWYKPVLKPVIELYQKGGQVKLSTAFHESGHYILDNFMSKAEKQVFIDKARKELGPMRDLGYKIKGYRRSADQRAEEYLMDKYAEARVQKFEAEARGEKYEYDPKYKSFFDRLDEILKKIVDAYKKMVAKIKVLYAESREGGYVKNPFSDEEPVPKLRTRELTPEDANMRRPTAAQELANKQYLKNAGKEALAELPKEEVMKIRRKEHEIRATYTDKPKAEQELGQIISEMDLAEKGTRSMIGSGPDARFIATPSLFPKWVPEDLRSKGLFDKVIARVDSLQNLHYPDRTVSLREAKLVDEIYNELDRRLKLDTSDLRSGITNEYTPEGRLQARDTVATNKLLESEHKKTARMVREEENTKQHLERVKKAEEESIKKIKEEQLYNSTLQEKINLAKREAKQSKGFTHKIKETLYPVRSLDPKTQQIAKNWLDRKQAIKEVANDEYRKNLPLGPQNFKEVMDFQAGKQTPYIKDAFDSLGTEFKRRGLDFNWLEDYVPQVWRDEGHFKTVAEKYLKEKGLSDEEIKAYLEGQPIEQNKALRLKLRPNFVKERFFPDYKSGMERGLKPKYKSPAQLIAYYREQGETSLNNKDFIDKLKSEAKLLPSSDAPDTWEPVSLRFAREGLYARPELARMINGIFRDEGNLGLIPWTVKGGSKVAKFMFDVKTMAGVPFTTVNSFAIGQANRLVVSALGNLVSGDMKGTVSGLKGAFAFIRANSNSASARWFSDNQDYLLKWASTGARVPMYPGSYDTFQKSISDVLNNPKVGENVWQRSKIRLGNVGRGSSYLWNKAINEKTMNSMMFQMEIQTFKDTYIEARAKGLEDEQATKFAGEVSRAFSGLAGETGRGKTTTETINATLTAPYFRESVLSTLWNAGKGSSSEWRNPIYSKSRKFAVGLIVTYAIYNALNKSLNDNYMWENPPGHEWQLRIPMSKFKEGSNEVIYTDFMPSFLAIARNLTSGLYNVGTGHYDVAKQKLGSIFSTPIQLTTEVLANSDYFGRQIYKPTDTPDKQRKDIATYVGLSFTHPYILELSKMASGSQPLDQTIARMAELPLKFGSLDAEQKAKYYNMLDKQTADRARAKDRIKPIYDKNQDLKAEGKAVEANMIYNALPKADKAIYDIIKTTEKSNNTKARKPAIQGIFDSNQELIKSGNLQEANNIYLQLSKDDRRIYDNIKKAAKKNQ